MAKDKAKAKTETVKENSSSRQGILSSLSLGAVIAELVGTFALTITFLNTSGNAIVAALAVLILVLMLSKLTGGYFNPAITIGLLASKQISWVKAVGYIVAQILGAMLAVIVAQQFMAGTTDLYGQEAEVYSVIVTGDWKPFFGELIGGAIFGLGVAGAIFTKKEDFAGAFTIGGSYLIALIVATSGSLAIINPALALASGALDTSNLWGLWSYAVAPIIGASIGMLLYKLLQSDIASSKK
ncbi:MAG: aquaporin [Candidatus Woesebacteria bacterium]|jgi:glycerol uptake facilitator-like aquaporin